MRPLQTELGPFVPPVLPREASAQSRLEYPTRKRIEAGWPKSTMCPAVALPPYPGWSSCTRQNLQRRRTFPWAISVEVPSPRARRLRPFDDAKCRRRLCHNRGGSHGLSARIDVPPAKKTVSKSRAPSPFFHPCPSVQVGRNDPTSQPLHTRALTQASNKSSAPPGWPAALKHRHRRHAPLLVCRFILPGKAKTLCGLPFPSRLPPSDMRVAKSSRPLSSLFFSFLLSLFLEKQNTTNERRPRPPENSRTAGRGKGPAIV